MTKHAGFVGELRAGRPRTRPTAVKGFEVTGAVRPIRLSVAEPGSLYPRSSEASSQATLRCEHVGRRWRRYNEFQRLTPRSQLVGIAALALTAACLHSAGPAAGASRGPVVWSAGLETGNLSEWRRGTDTRRIMIPAGAIARPTESRLGMRTEGRLR